MSGVLRWLLVLTLAPAAWLLPLVLQMGWSQPSRERSAPAALPFKAGDEVCIATWNLAWFFDDDVSDNRSSLARKMRAPSPDEYRWRLAETARAIAAFRPTVLALQEIENEKVVKDLAAALALPPYNLRYRVGFIEGKDTATEQDVAFLVEDRGPVVFSRVERSGLTFSNRNLFTIPSKHLALHVVHRSGEQEQRLSILTAHLKAGGRASNEAVRIKQSRVLHAWAADLMAKGQAVIVLGDFNASKRFLHTTSADAMGVLRGLATSRVDDDLTDLHGDLEELDRRSHVSGREFDRILVSPNLLDERGLVLQNIHALRHLVVRGMPDDDPNKTLWDYLREERDLSDHYPLVATFRWVP